ncbi:T9SS type A sorting domain-containing protein [Fulvivirgaceae bacterium PWU4]|uniref:T9SS type A sorting domain-containing protein n=1 Tax=Chryseosolibacter histidini TaxID=2782349 RepID=A0AAP2GN89_9BACT|nr:MBG domain-containing protein [Chryseosolibacter histidini]MBT1696640.1 T9SS type A sorting domain-containing protein [Chryseosolibacter histidini]
MTQFYRLCGVWAAALLLAFSASAQSTYYVKANASGSNNGTSWTNAFTDLQRAIDVAVSGDQIWVAAGTYKPSKDMAGSTTPADARTKTFVIKNGVKLYGGFAGTETTLGQRNETVNATILSGDINGNDGGDFVNNGENVYHVMVANAITTETVLDGFIITGGNANLTSAFLGMSYGHQYGGGLISSQVNTNLAVTRCIFRGNYAGFGGGAMQLYYSAPVISGCVFAGNSVSNSYGGAIYFEHGSPVIASSVFTGNKSDYQGGALYIFNYSDPVIVNSTFTDNYAKVNGGAIYVRNSCTVDIRNSVIWNNTGGGTQAVANEGIAVIGVTYSDVQGGYTGTGNINIDPAFHNASDADGADNLWRTADDGLALRAASPLANTGSNAAIPAGVTTDILGNARILNTTVNMGAYEALLPAVRYYVNGSAWVNGNGSSWYNTFNNLQSAIDVAVSGDEIWVAAGTYKPTKDITGSGFPADARTRTFLIKNGVKLYGGFAGLESTLNERDFTANPTVLTGDMWDNDESNFINNGENVYHVTTASGIVSPTVLDGFIIKGGNANLTAAFLGMSYGHQYGGGLICSQVNTNLSVTRCIFKDNYAGFGGGAMQLYYSDPAITGCVFANNSVSNSYGGAMYFDHGSPVIANSVFTGNKSSYQGGALYIFNYSSPLIVNSTFTGNYAYVDGGAVYMRNTSTVNLKNAIIWGNTGGGAQAIANEGSATVNVTYSDVQGGYTGAGNINADPAFAQGDDADGYDNLWFTLDDGLALLSDSPAANTGSNAAIPAGIATDILGNNRIVNTTVNMGAYELLRLTSSVALTNTSTVYDGTPKYVDVITEPAGLTALISYNRDGHDVSDPADAGVYQVTVVIDDATHGGIKTGTLTIAKATATIRFENLVHTYDGEEKWADIITTPEGLPVREVYTQNDEEVSVYNAGTYELTATIQDNNYEGTAVETFTINKAPATLNVSGLEYVYDGMAKTVTVTSGPADFENITVTFRQDGNIVAQPVNAGSYEVEAKLENANYAATVSKTLVIAKASQSITFNALTPRTFGDAPVTLDATASSGATVTYTSSNTAVATVSGNQLTLVGAGTTTITAIQAGDQNHGAAANVERALTVTPKQQSITFDALQERTMGERTFSIVASASSGLPVTFTSSNPAVATVSGNTITLVGAGTTVIKANQSGDSRYASAQGVERTLTVRKRTQSITFSALTEKILGETDFQLAATTSSGLVISYASSDPAVATVVGNTVTLRGAGETTITATQQGNAQFDAATPVSQTLVVRLVTGIEAGYDNAVKVYPNPVIDHITVESHGPDNIFSVRDVTGKVVLNPSALLSDGKQHTLDLGSLTSGVYYLSISTGKSIVSKRIVKK